MTQAAAQASRAPSLLVKQQGIHTRIPPGRRQEVERQMLHPQVLAGGHIQAKGQTGRQGPPGDPRAQDAGDAFLQKQGFQTMVQPSGHRLPLRRGPGPRMASRSSTRDSR